MKPNIVVYSPKAINSNFYGTNFQRLSVLNELKDKYNFIFVTFRKSSSDVMKDELFNKSGFMFDEVVTYPTHQDEMFGKTPKYSSWKEYLEHEDLYQFDNVEHIIVAGNPLMSSAGICRDKNVLGDIMDTNKFMKFLSNALVISGMFQIINLAKRNPNAVVHNLLRDPLENALSHTDYIENKQIDYHDYDSPLYGFERFDGYQYFLEHVKNPNIFEPEKIYDFVFGFSAITKERKPVYDRFVNGIQETDKNKIFIKNPFEKIDTFVDRDTYLDYVEQARFTLNVPSYDVNHFSTARFVESIYRNCLPLISSDVKVDEWASSFGIDEDLLNELVVDYSDIQSRIDSISEEKRLDLLERVKEKVLVYRKGLSI